jgi:DnaJ family protein C protein 28
MTTPLEQLPALQRRLTREAAAALRDADWASMEAGYHARAVGEVNALVRKYNGLAPAAVRRGYYSVDAERARAYDAAADDVLEGLRARVDEARGAGEGAQREDEDEEDKVREWDGMKVKLPGVNELLRGFWQRLFSQWRS